MTKNEMIKEIKKCKLDPWYYLTTYWKTFDMETGKVKSFAEYNEQWDIPTYRDKIHELVIMIIDRVRAYRAIKHPDLAIEKTRQMTVTNTISATCGYLISFMNEFRGLFTHEKEEKMDKPGDFNTPFGMIDFGIDKMPDFLKPSKQDMIRSHMKIGLKSRNSLITGDAGIRPGAGGGFHLINNTEFAHQENTNSKLAAETEACKGVNILESTPKGKFNAHAITCEFAQKNPDKTSFLYVPLHWSLRRTKEWYEWKKLSYNGDEARIAQELDMSREGSVTGRVFKLFKPTHLVDIDPLKFRPAISVNGFDFGWIHSTACVFIAPFINDTWVVYDEYMDNEKPVHVHAHEVNEIARRWEVKNNYWTADPSGVSKSREMGKSFYELYQGADVPVDDRLRFEPADNAIKEGISSVNTMFWKDKLLISKKCVNLIDALNEAVYPTNKNDEPTQEKYKEDWYTDICDALRYGVSRLAKYQSIVQSRQFNKPYRPVSQGLGMGAYGGKR